MNKFIYDVLVPTPKFNTEELHPMNVIEFSTSTHVYRYIVVSVTQDKLTVVGVSQHTATQGVNLPASLGIVYYSPQEFLVYRVTKLC